MTGRPVDYEDVQGLVRFAYRELTEASYLLLRIADGGGARRWLGTAPIATAVCTPTAPDSAIQVAFTAQGLRALGLAEETLGAFSAEFLAGMSADPSRSRRLGDVGENAPSTWTWGSGERIPDAVVMLFAKPGGLTRLQDACASAWAGAFTTIAALDTSNLGVYEQFGFTDGISQPNPDWDRRLDAPADGLTYRNLVALGEFLLGYKNEYGKYTERPLIGNGATGTGLLAAEDAPDRRDLGLNGTYIAIRDLRQDVRGFWRSIAEAAPKIGLDRDALAAAFVGRRRDGTPLVPPADRPIEGDEAAAVPSNQFVYEADPDGLRCPFGAHIRRANPRTADYAKKPANALALVATALGFTTQGLRDDLTSSVRFHRILRRGREYGPPLLTPEAALEPAPSGERDRGLRFVCANASLARQFEFVQNAWLVSAKFNGLTGENDPLLGNRASLPGDPAADGFTLPQDGALRRRIAGVPRFVTVCGGAYFFLPSLRALRYLASRGAPMPANVTGGPG